MVLIAPEMIAVEYSDDQNTFRTSIQNIFVVLSKLYLESI